MPAYARHVIVADDEVGVYHCITRCVRDGNEDAASIDAGHRNWYQLTLCQERRESHQEALYTTS
jgi:hypothetical protein